MYKHKRIPYADVYVYIKCLFILETADLVDGRPIDCVSLPEPFESNSVSSSERACVSLVSLSITITYAELFPQLFEMRQSITIISIRELSYRNVKAEKYGEINKLFSGREA